MPAGSRRCRKLGFVGRADVQIADILTAVESGKTKVWVTNPTQSNSGATILFGFMNYFAGNGPGQALTQQQLDSPHGGSADDAKRKVLGELQAYLLQDGEAKAKLLKLGRRPASSIGLTLDNPDLAVFNPDWGIQANLREQGIQYPAASVIQSASDRYQTAYRKPRPGRGRCRRDQDRSVRCGQAGQGGAPVPADGIHPSH